MNSQNTYQTCGDNTAGQIFNQNYQGYWQYAAQNVQFTQLAYLNNSQREVFVAYAGNLPLVVCGDVTKEAKDLAEAQRFAEELAHQKGANAYILKPVKLVAPKRDVVVTDL